MQTTYNLLKEQDDSNRKTLWLSMLLLLIVMLVILGVVVLYYMRHIRRRNRTMLKVLNSLDAYRRAVINGEPPTSPEVVAAIEELQSINLPGNESAEDRDEEPDDEDRRLFVEMDMQVTRDQLFLKPGLGRDDLMRLIGVDKNRFGKMMSKYSDASNTSVYINTKRVEFGARLLVEHPEYTIATIATECGMSNTVTFNRTFKEVYNMTPSEYKEIFVKK
jgi:AraC-like DNA-binding protein